MYRMLVSSSSVVQLFGLSLATHEWTQAQPTPAFDNVTSCVLKSSLRIIPVNVRQVASISISHCAVEYTLLVLHLDVEYCPDPGFTAVSGSVQRGSPLVGGTSWEFCLWHAGWQHISNKWFLCSIQSSISKACNYAINIHAVVATSAPGIGSSQGTIATVLRAACTSLSLAHEYVITATMV